MLYCVLINIHEYFCFVLCAISYRRVNVRHGFTMVYLLYCISVYIVYNGHVLSAYIVRILMSA